ERRSSTCSRGCRLRRVGAAERGAGPTPSPSDPEDLLLLGRELFLGEDAFLLQLGELFELSRRVVHSAGTRGLFHTGVLLLHRCGILVRVSLLLSSSDPT